MVDQPLNEPTEAIATKTTFVFDTRTGEVVHVHQLVAIGPQTDYSDDEMERAARQLAPADLDRAHLGIIHEHGAGREYSPQHQYRVDVKTRRLVVEAAPIDFPSAERTRKQRP